MSLSYRQRRHLRCIGRSLGAADPHLAAMLAIFARLATGQAMPTLERMPRRIPLPVRVLARAAVTVARLVVRVFLACVRAVRTAGVGLAATCPVLPGRLRSAARARLRAGTDPWPSPSGMDREGNS
jgi:hypothetical protein